MLWNAVLEKTPESPLDSKEIKPVNIMGNQPWLFIGWTDAEAEAPILQPPDAKSRLIGEDWRQKEKRVAEDEMVLDSITDSTDMTLSKSWETAEDRGAQHAAVREVAESDTT